jgi:hypothetical protein
VLDEGEEAQLCAPAPDARDVLPASGAAAEGCEGAFACRGGLVLRCEGRELVATCARGCAVQSLDFAASPIPPGAAAAVLCRRAPGDAGSAR